MVSFFAISGRSYSVFNQKMLNAAIESLVSKVQNGVVIQFEKIGLDPPILQNDLPKLESELGGKGICSNVVNLSHS